MKSIFTLAVFFIVYGATAQSKTEKEITTLSSKRVEWLREAKWDSLATIYDEKSITVHGNGMIKTMDEHFEDIRNGRPVYKKIRIASTTVRDFGDVAILVGKGTFDIAMNGQEMSYEMAYTEVYQKKGKQWKLISRQASNIQ